MTEPLITSNPWSVLSRFTSARIGLGRVGASLPTESVLDLTMAHARARDAVHTSFDVDDLRRKLEGVGFRTKECMSRANTREEYLRRPDLGRRLANGDVAALTEESAPQHRLTIVVGDGLSSLAPSLHALPTLLALRPLLEEWEIDEIVLARNARVALSDEIGVLRKAETVMILIGERPGLKAADSLAAYVTWDPRIGRSNAERNCISNIRHEGLEYDVAAAKLSSLLQRARVLGATGIALKDDEGPVLPGRGNADDL